MMTIKLIVADNQAVFLAEVKKLLECAAQFQLLCRCASADETVNAVRRFKPRILLLSARILRQSGFNLVHVLTSERRLAVAIVVVATDLTAAETWQLTQVGISGIVSEDAPAESLIRCLEKVAAGERWLDERIANRLLGPTLMKESRQAEIAKLLARREFEIARLAALGVRNKKIGRRLFIDEGKVKTHHHHVFVRLRLSGRHALANLLRISEI